MADYYSLLARAVGNLPQSTTDTRRAIYERARAALLGQLRNLNPPAPESAIDNESRALDTAIERLEIEIADKDRALARDMAAPIAAVAETPALASDGTPASTPELAATPPLLLKPRIAAPVRPNMALQGDTRPIGRPMPPRAAPVAGTQPPASRTRFWIIAALGAVVVVAIAVAATVLPNAPFNKAAFKPAGLAPTQQPDAKAGKIGGRIGGGSNPADTKRQPIPPAPAVVEQKPPSAAPPVEKAPGPDASTALPVSQSAALLVQTGDTPQSVKAFVGSVVWRMETAAQGSAQPLQNSIRADVDVPEARFKAIITIQNNLDAALPASHTMSIQFIPAPDSPVGNIKAIDVPEMREAGAASGERLIGTSVAITPNNFLAALARGDAIVPRNLELIRNRAWFDVPMQLENNKLAKLTLEKGASGDQVIANALASWAK